MREEDDTGISVQEARENTEPPAAQPLPLPNLTLLRGMEKKSSLNTKPPGATCREFSEEGTVG